MMFGQESKNKISLADPPAPLSASAEECVLHLRELIHRGDFEIARDRLAQYSERWPEDRAIAQLKAILAPPKARVASAEEAPQFAAERGWLRHHGREHPGQWLAVLGDQLLDRDADVDELRRRLGKNPEGASALVHYEPG